MPDNSILSYADDTAVVATGKTWAEVGNIMNKFLEDVSIWLSLNKLTLNTQKTVYITFGNYCDSVPNDIEIKMNNVLLCRVHSVKYLGITFDANIKWNKHIEYLINKTRYLIFIFSKISKIMDILTHYTSFTMPSFTGVALLIAWGGAYQTKLKILQTVQTRILKIINKNTFQTNTLLNLIKYDKRISTKSSYIKAINIFNNLPNENKTLGLRKKSNKKKLKDWVSKNE